MAGSVWNITAQDLARAAVETPFDAVIVGGGTSGLATAISLHEAGLGVAVLEAGPAPFLTHITNTGLRFAPELLRNLRNVTRYTPKLAGGGFFGNNYGCLGGRGLFWNGAAPRYSAEDFAHWPFTAADLQEDYRWAETQFRVSTSMGNTEIGKRTIELLRKGGLAAEPGPFAADIDDLYYGRLSAGIASALGPFFRSCGDALAAGSVQLAIETMAQGIVVENGKVTGIVAATGSGKAVEIPCRAAVLAGGGIESIKLAALSGLPDPEGRIGLGVQEHLFYSAMLDAVGIYDSAARDSAIVYVRAPTQDAHQWEMHIPGNRLFALDAIEPWAPAATSDYQLMIRAFAATEKRDDNRIEAAPGGLGSATVHFTHSAADEESKQRIVADAERLCTAINATAIDGQPIGSTERFRAPGSSYHEAGGLDMGEGPGNSVTDGYGRFHHLPNLICSDAATFPRIGATNPHLTILAVARRKGRALAEALK